MASGHLLVGAIDFGTTNSGWAYSFQHDFESDPTKSFVKQWHSGSGTLVTEKTPTCLLVKPDGTFAAFGYEAENMYRDLTDSGEHKEYYYFRRFKMLLNKKIGEKLDLSKSIEDEMGKSMPAVKVFSMSIRYLFQDMMAVIGNRLTDTLRTDDVHMVITVPAIWTDAAKQFMRVAAIEAGINSKNLTIALEPEAASIFCRYLSVNATLSGGEVSISKMPVGTKYMILDAGGGTIDITVHEVISAKSVKEVVAASGGGWGGVMVDKAFEDFLIQITGHRVYEIFKREETEDWLDLFRDFEVKKKNVAPGKATRINIKFPLSFGKIYEKITKKSLSQAMAETKYKDDIDYGGDKIKFASIVFKDLFNDSLRKTIDHIKDLYQKGDVCQIKAILMVGGYSESPMMQQAVKDAFPDVNVVIPIEASSSILKGALIYGHSPMSVEERVLKYTYGVGTTKPFRNGIDPERHKVVTDTGERCRVFSKHVEKGQTVMCKEPQIEKGYRTSREFQKKIRFPIYATELHSMTYYDEGGVKIGDITLDIPNPEKETGRRVVVSMTFSGTEIEVKAVDEKSGKEARTYTDFLG